MSKRQIENLLKLNIPLILINIVIFSKGLLGLSFSGSGALEKAFVITDILVSLFLAIYGNYNIIFKEPTSKLINTSSLKTPNDWIELLENYTNKGKVSNNIKLAIDQIKDLDKRLKSLENILLQYFSVGELTYNEYKNVITLATNIFYKNIEKMLNRVNFLSTVSLKENQNAEIKNRNEEVIKDVKQLVDRNNEILSELYNLNFELCNLDSKDDAENSRILEQLKSIIKNVELYG